MGSVPAATRLATRLAALMVQRVLAMRVMTWYNHFRQTLHLPDLVSGLHNSPVGYPSRPGGRCEAASSRGPTLKVRHDLNEEEAVDSVRSVILSAAIESVNFGCSECLTIQVNDTPGMRPGGEGGGG
jgi:hypothetical protein